MKRISVAITMAFLLSIITAGAFAGEAEFNGTLIGAGSGAIIGHIAGGGAESVLIGSVIGGVLGYTVSNIHNRGDIHLMAPPFFLPPPPHYHGYRKYHRKYHYNKHRIRHKLRCKTVKKHVLRHGHSYTVKKRICPERWEHNYGHGEGYQKKRDYQF